ncbi:MAG: ATP-binding protein [Deltaproteobacteria bacterium]|nr:ATP-binding protein [Deltaproteobacteria bacterium]
MKLKWKLLILFTSVSLVITATLAALLHNRLYADRFLLIRTDTEEQLRHIDFSLSLYLDEAENDVRTLAQNGDVRSKSDQTFTNFTGAEEKTFQYRIGPAEQRIVDLFETYRLTHPSVNAVYMGRENGSFVRSHKRERPSRYDPRTRPWYLQAKRSPDRVVITEPYPSVTTQDVNIGIVKALVDEVDQFYGVVGMDITLVKLTDYLLNFRIDPQSRILVVDRKGVVLASQEKEQLFAKIDTVSPELGKILLGGGLQDNAVTLGGVKHFVFLRESPRVGWMIAVLVPAASIDRAIRYPILLTTAGLVCGLLFLSLLALVGLNLFVLRPLDHLNKTTDRIAETSDLDRQVRVFAADEIGMLAASFNEMIRSLNATQRALKEAEQGLIEYREHLEDLVKQRTAELACARDQAQEADRLKSAFLASMSHELRTPLNSIIGFTGILLQKLSGPINEEQAKQLNMVRNSSHHLLQLINEVLDISKIEAGQLTLDPAWFDIGQSIDTVMKLVQPLAEKKGLLVKLEVPSASGRIHHDQRRVEQVLINLVNNAVKFTEQGEISIRCDRQNDEVVVTVSDTGIGIKPEDMGILFETFRQIETGLTRRYEGTGLGLSISRRLVELMGGRIWAESEGPGRGSRFTFTLPAGGEENGHTENFDH